MYRIAMRSLAAACLTLSCLGAVAAQSTETHGDDLHAMFEAAAGRDQFNGVALVAINGEVLIEQGYGLADRQLNVAAMSENRFKIGSMSKSFTAALVLLLVEDGLIDLDARVTEYWPGFEDPSDAGITVRHLITHQSGLEHWNAVDGFLLRDARLPWDPRELVNLYAAEGLRFQPGDDERYSSLGFMAAAIVVEHVTGEAYFDVLRTRILDPLGMTDTVVESTALIHGLVSDYRFNFLRAEYENGEFRDPSTQFGTGDLISTAADLFVWSSAIRGERADVLPPSITDQILAVDDDSRAFGWNRDRTEEGGLILSHGGLVAGYRSQIRINIETGVTMVFLGNQRDFDSGRLTENVLAVLSDADRTPVRHALHKEVYELSARDDNNAVVSHIRDVYAHRADEYYEAPIAWLVAAMELRSDGACDRALPLFELWAELHPGHAYQGFALMRGIDCAASTVDVPAGLRLLSRFEAISDDADQIQNLREQVAAIGE